MIQIFDWLAMAGPATGTGEAQNPLTMMMPMMLIFAIFYFMLIRPQQRKERERRDMITNLKSGARVVVGGMLGTITNVKDNTFVVKIADNTKVEVLKGAVSQVVEKGEKPTEEETR